MMGEEFKRKLAAIVAQAPMRFVTIWFHLGYCGVKKVGKR